MHYCSIKSVTKQGAAFYGENDLVAEKASNAPLSAVVFEKKFRVSPKQKTVQA